MIPCYFKIEILAIQDEFVLLGHKGLTVEPSIIRYLVKVRIGNAFLNFLAGKISCLVNWLPRHRNRIYKCSAFCRSLQIFEKKIVKKLNYK